MVVADPVESARRGENPDVLCRLESGWAVMGWHQRLPGYCVLLHDGDADHLTDLDAPARQTFLTDMARLGEAVTEACRDLDPGFARVNYEILGNRYHCLHAHVRARYAWEPEEFRHGPVWWYPDLTAPEHDLGPQHDELRSRLVEALGGSSSDSTT